MSKIFMNLPILTPRLSIRGPQPEDFADIKSALEESRTELQRWLNWATPWPSSEDTDKWLHQSVKDFSEGVRHVRFEGFDRETGKFLISLGCTTMSDSVFHISYWARTSATGKGYMTEAVNALTHYLFETCKADRIESGHEIGNIASQRVLEKCGFQHEKAINQTFPDKPGFIRKEKLYVLNRTV